MRTRGKIAPLPAAVWIFVLFWTLGPGSAAGQSGARQPGAVVFVGDSLTAGIDWSALFERPRLYNHGVAGDGTVEILARLGPVIARAPARVFIMAGVNDLARGRGQEEIVRTYRRITATLAQAVPGAELFVQGVLPVDDVRLRARVPNRDIIRLNERLRALTEEQGLVYIDLFPRFVGPDGRLKPELTPDGLHLTAPGYQVWKQALAPYLAD
ncbi:MAG: GDSL-type esterase/lipase family protein [Pseudomonadota bacterium]